MNKFPICLYEYWFILEKVRRILKRTSLQAVAFVTLESAVQYPAAHISGVLISGDAASQISP